MSDNPQGGTNAHSSRCLPDTARCLEGFPFNEANLPADLALINAMPLDVFSEFAPLTAIRCLRKVDHNAKAFNPIFKENDMTKKASGAKTKPMTQDAKARIYSTTARENDGIIPLDSFASRAASAADKTKK